MKPKNNFKRKHHQHNAKLRKKKKIIKGYKLLFHFCVFRKSETSKNKNLAFESYRKQENRQHLVKSNKAYSTSFLQQQQKSVTNKATAHNQSSCTQTILVVNSLIILKVINEEIKAKFCAFLLIIFRTNFFSLNKSNVFKVKSKQIQYNNSSKTTKRLMQIRIRLDFYALFDAERKRFLEIQLFRAQFFSPQMLCVAQRK